MASMKSKFSFGKKKSHDEAEEVEESEAEEEPAGPSESLETREQASHKTPAKSQVTTAARAALQYKEVAALAPAAVVDEEKLMCRHPSPVEEDAPIPAAPASTPDGPRSPARCSTTRATLMRRRRRTIMMRARRRTASARCLL